MAQILIIDDEPSVRRVMRKSLELEGHRVVEATNGAEGLAIARTGHVDLVVTDLIMPEMEGIETIRLFREEFPRVAIVAMSGGGRIEPDDRLTDAELLGADATLRKPFTPEDLAALVSNVLG